MHFLHKIPIAARVQTTFFGLHMIQHNALNGQKSIAKTFMWNGFQVPVRCGINSFQRKLYKKTKQY